MKGIAYLLLFVLFYSMSIPLCAEAEDDCCNDDPIEIAIQADHDSENEPFAEVCFEPCCQKQWNLSIILKIKQIKSATSLPTFRPSEFKELSESSVWDPPRFLS